MNTYFTQQNTEGYTDAQLADLNQLMDNALGNGATSIGQYREDAIQQIAEEVIRDYDTVLNQAWQEAVDAEAEIDAADGE